MKLDDIQRELLRAENPLGDTLDLNNHWEAWTKRIENGELKEAINLFLWINANPKLQLYQLERLAITIYRMLMD